jgi:hypothetical protein
MVVPVIRKKKLNVLEGYDVGQRSIGDSKFKETPDGYSKLEIVSS